MTDYSNQTVAQLKDLLKEKNLPTEGKKADLVQRLEEGAAQDNGDNGQEEQDKANDSKTEETGEEIEQKKDNKEGDEENGSTLTVIPPSEKKEEEEEKESAKPKQLSPEERKQLAVDLLTKKIQRAEKFGDEESAQAARKDLARVEKFGVEVGTALAREIGIVDRGLPSSSSKRKPFRSNKKFRGGFKSKKGFKPRYGRPRNAY